MPHEGPPGRSTSLRARNSDRDEVISLLGTAYVDGQLTGAEHEARVARALTARTVGDLFTLIDDLLPEPEKTALHDAVHRRPVVRSRALVAAAVVLALVVVSVVGALLDNDGEDQVTVVTTPFVPEEPVLEEPDLPAKDPEPEPQHEPLTVAALQEFIVAYSEEFSTTEIYDASFRDDGHVSFEALHGPARKNRLQGWRWDPVDGFSSPDDPSANVFAHAPVDLEQLDLEALMQNMERARNELAVENPDSTRFALDDRRTLDGPPRVRIYVSNDFNESAMMTTTLAGEVISSHPFSPDGE